MRRILTEICCAMWDGIRDFLCIKPPMPPEVRERAHRMILLACAGPSLRPGPDGKIHIDAERKPKSEEKEDAGSSGEQEE